MKRDRTIYESEGKFLEMIAAEVVTLPVTAGTDQMKYRPVGTLGGGREGLIVFIGLASVTRLLDSSSVTSRFSHTPKVACVLGGTVFE